MNCFILEIKQEPVEPELEEQSNQTKEDQLNLEEDIKPAVEAMEAQEYDTRSEAEGSDRAANSEAEEENKEESGLCLQCYSKVENKIRG